MRYLLGGGTRPLTLGEAGALASRPSTLEIRPERARDRRRRWLLVAEAKQAPRPCVWRMPLDYRLARLYHRRRARGGGWPVKLRWIHRRRTWATRDQLRCALFDYVECFYNPVRIQERLGYRSPADFESASVA